MSGWNGRVLSGCLPMVAAFNFNLVGAISGSDMSTASRVIAPAAKT
jgi:hypothetical protein